MDQGNHNDEGTSKLRAIINSVNHTLNTLPGGNFINLSKLSKATDREERKALRKCAQCHINAMRCVNAFGLIQRIMNYPELRSFKIRRGQGEYDNGFLTVQSLERPVVVACNMSRNIKMSICWVYGCPDKPSGNEMLTCNHHFNFPGTIHTKVISLMEADGDNEWSILRTFTRKRKRKSPTLTIKSLGKAIEQKIRASTKKLAGPLSASDKRLMKLPMKLRIINSEVKIGESEEDGDLNVHNHDDLLFTLCKGLFQGNENCEVVVTTSTEHYCKTCMSRFTKIWQVVTYELFDNETGTSAFYVRRMSDEESVHQALKKNTKRLSDTFFVRIDEYSVTSIKQCYEEKLSIDIWCAVIISMQFEADKQGKDINILNDYVQIVDGAKIGRLLDNMLQKNLGIRIQHVESESTEIGERQLFTPYLYSDKDNQKARIMDRKDGSARIYMKNNLETTGHRKVSQVYIGQHGTAKPSGNALEVPVSHFSPDDKTAARLITDNEFTDFECFLRCTHPGNANHYAVETLAQIAACIMAYLKNTENVAISLKNMLTSSFAQRTPYLTELKRLYSHMAKCVFKDRELKIGFTLEAMKNNERKTIHEVLGFNEVYDD